MPSPTETAAQTYVAAWQERDAVNRVRLIDECFAGEGRIVSRGTLIRGRSALAAAITDFYADPRGLSARLVSAIDAQGPIFRFCSAIKDSDGRIVFEGFDAGEVNVDGRITVLLTFGGASLIPVP